MTATIQRIARTLFAFVMMNAAAVSGLLSLGRGRRVWR